MRAVHNSHKTFKIFAIAIWLFIAILPNILAVPNVSYDLSNSVVAVLAGSQITEVVVDSERDIVYFGTIDGKLGYYNASSNTSTDLTSTISGFVSGEFYGMTLDTTDNRLYFSAGQLNNEVGYYELSTNTSTSLPLASFTWFTKLAYDPERNVIWYASNDGDMGYISKLNDTKNPKGITGGAVSDICLDNYFNRLYVYYITSTKFPEYYAIDNETQVDLSGSHPMDINSCAIDQINHRIYLGTPNGFDFQRVYFQLNDSVQPLYFSGDTAGTPKTVYIPYNNMVGFIEYSAFGDGMMYNATANINFYLWTTDQDDWMAPYFMDAADYNNITNRMYIGFTGGGFGYYDNNFPAWTPPPYYFVLNSTFINQSSINLSNISNYVITGRFLSYNYTNLNITLLINGTYEDSILAVNNTDFNLVITSINETGNYVFRLNSSEGYIIYYFTVNEIIPVAYEWGVSLIAIALLLIFGIFLFAYLGINNYNEVIKLLFCMIAVIGITGLFQIAVLIGENANIYPGIISILRWFVIASLLATLFTLVYFVYILILFVLKLIADLRAGKDILGFRKKEENDIFK